MYFNSFKRKPIHMNLEYKNYNIQQAHCAKFRGVTLDGYFTWKHHIEMKTIKINQFVFALSKIKYSTSRKTAIAVYHAYVCLLIRFGIVVWGNSPELERIFIAQKICIPAIFNMQWLTRAGLRLKYIIF